MTHTNGAPLPIALVGLGGYGATICRLLEEQSRVPDPPVRLVGVFEPDVATHGARLAELREAGIATASSYAELLAGPSEAVWLPIPIHLHRPFTEQALAAGKAVLCEKPVAGAVEDLAAMRAARDHAGRPVAIGFQDLYDPATHAIKRRLLDGTIGQPRAATLLACWPRDSSYYGRNAWAGAFRRDGIWVMDSPLSNAISHYANLALFWLGDAPAATAVPLAVDAELYRANPIENYDTCALRVHLAGGHTLLILFTHACQRQIDPQITITGTAGTLRMGEGRDIVLRDTNGTVIGRKTITADRHTPMVRDFAAWVRGEPGATVYATLEQAAAHLTICNGTSEATAISTVSPEMVEVSTTANGATLRAIRGIEAAFEACAARGVLPSESGLAGWSAAAGSRDLRGYERFGGPRG